VSIGVIVEMDIGVVTTVRVFISGWSVAVTQAVNHSNIVRTNII